MITAVILIYSALLFFLGVMVGSIAKKGEEVLKKPKPTADLNREIINFLNYDGTEQ